jgi:hypothetical protein
LQLAQNISKPYSFIYQSIDVKFEAVAATEQTWFDVSGISIAFIDIKFVLIGGGPMEIWMTPLRLSGFTLPRFPASLSR